MTEVTTPTVGSKKIRVGIVGATDDQHRLVGCIGALFRQPGFV